MSKLRFTAAIVTIAALSGLTTVPAQQPRLGAAQQRAGENDQRDSQSTGSQTDRYEARRASTATGQMDKSLETALAQKLQLASSGEIELAKMAQEKVDHPELQQLAQTIIQDHQQLSQTLQPFADRSGSAATASRTDTTPGQSATERNSQRAGSNRAQSQGESATVMVPHELCQLVEQAHQNQLEMTKEMLSNYEGQDFQMAFLGQQIFAHATLIAELKAIESHGPQQLQAVAQQALTKVQQHLERSKQLAKKFEDDAKSRS